MATATRRKKTDIGPVLVGDEKFLTVPAYSRTRSVHRRTLSRWAKNDFPLLKVGGKLLIDPVAADAWIVAHGPGRDRAPASLPAKSR